MRGKMEGQGPEGRVTMKTANELSFLSTRHCVPTLLAGPPSSSNLPTGKRRSVERRDLATQLLLYPPPGNSAA